MRSSEDHPRCLILGIGNVLMGDEGVGVHCVRRLEAEGLPAGVACLDGGTGGLHLLEPVQSARHVILVDATVDGNPPGTIRRLRPRFSKDYPRALTAHDIGLKDLLDVMYLADQPPEVVLLVMSIQPLEGLCTELSPEVAEHLGALAERVREEARQALEAGPAS